jgi:hypothetical protein
MIMNLIVNCTKITASRQKLSRDRLKKPRVPQHRSQSQGDGRAVACHRMASFYLVCGTGALVNIGIGLALRRASLVAAGGYGRRSHRIGLELRGFLAAELEDPGLPDWRSHRGWSPTVAPIAIGRHRGEVG